MITQLKPSYRNASTSPALKSRLRLSSIHYPLLVMKTVTPRATPVCNGCLLATARASSLRAVRVPADALKTAPTRSLQSRRLSAGLSGLLRPPPKKSSERADDCLDFAPPLPLRIGQPSALRCLNCVRHEHPGGWRSALNLVKFGPPGGCSGLPRTLVVSA